MRTRSKVWAVPRSACSHWPFAIGVPEDQRLPALPSVTFDGVSAPALEEAVTVHAVRGRGVSAGVEPPPVTAWPVRRVSRDEEPTNTWWVPVVVVQAVVQDWKLRASRVIVTRWVCPAARVTRAKPRRFFGGSPAAVGCPTYTCGTSDP